MQRLSCQTESIAKSLTLNTLRVLDVKETKRAGMGDAQGHARHKAGAADSKAGQSCEMATDLPARYLLPGKILLSVPG